MSIHFKFPCEGVTYTLREIDSFNAFPKDDHDHIRQLQEMLPISDSVKYYVTPTAEDWFEDGIAIVRDGEIFLLAKLGEYHDCGVF